MPQSGETSTTYSLDESVSFHQQAVQGSIRLHAGIRCHLLAPRLHCMSPCAKVVPTRAPVNTDLNFAMKTFDKKNILRFIGL